jgi:hypothetical protein
MIAKKSTLLILTIILLNGNQSFAQANTQSVCVNKQTGEVRVSNQCKPDESKGTRKITLPKLSKAEQLKQKIAELEGLLITVQSERQLIFEEVLKSSPTEQSLESALESCSLQSNQQLEKCMYLGRLTRQLADLNRKQLEATKLLESTRVKAGIFRVLSCKKGSETLTIIDEKPKCPKGYK